MKYKIDFSVLHPKLRNGKPIKFGIYATNYLLSQLYEIVKKFDYVKKLWLYGSYAKRVARMRSDIDLIIELDDGCFDVREVEDALEASLQKQISLLNVLDYNGSWLQKCTDVERRKILVYDRDQEINKNIEPNEIESEISL